MGGKSSAPHVAAGSPEPVAANEIQAWLAADQPKTPTVTRPLRKPRPRGSIRAASIPGSHMPIAVAVPAGGSARDLELGQLRDDLQLLTAQVKAARAEAQAAHAEAERHKARNAWAKPRRPAAPPIGETAPHACNHACRFVLVVAAVVLCAIWTVNTCNDHYTERVNMCGPFAGTCWRTFSKPDCLRPVEESHLNDDKEADACLRPKTGYAQFTSHGRTAWQTPDGATAWGSLPEEHMELSAMDTCNGELPRIAAAVGFAALGLAAYAALSFAGFWALLGIAFVVLTLLNGTLVILSCGRIAWVDWWDVFGCKEGCKENAAAVATA